VSKRESEAHQTITRQGQFVKQYEAVNPVLNRATELARRYGADEPTVLNNLIEANEFLERDPVGGIKWLADLYNVDLSTLATGAMAQDPGAQAFDALQRQNAQLQQKIAEIEQGLQLTRQTTEQREVEAQVAKVRDSFPAVDEQALVRAIHELNGVIAAGLMEHPGPSKLLEKAYEKLGVKPKGDQAQAQARVDAAKKAAPLSVKSSPANTTKVGSLEDTLGEIARRAYR
jgi:cell division protein FtsB